MAHLNNRNAAASKLAKPSEHQLKKKLISGLFFRYSSALTAYEELRETGYEIGSISIVMLTETWQKQFLEVLVEPTRRAQIKAVPSGNCKILGSNHLSSLRMLISTSRLNPGMGIIFSGPIGLNENTSNEEGSVLSGTFQKWGLSASTSTHYEEEVLSGGIFIGVDAHSKKHDNFRALQNQNSPTGKYHLAFQNAGQKSPTLRILTSFNTRCMLG